MVNLPDVVIRLGLLAGALALALAAASTARADYETLRVYWGEGLAFYGDYHTSAFDGPCRPYSGSAAESHGYGWTTVALIDGGGTWRFANRSGESIVQTFVQPDTYWSASSWQKKAFCKNSGSTSMSMTCSYWIWVEEPVHSGCV